MAKPTLLIMAAGIGSRYGGLKQIDPVGPGGEIIIDYSVYDALRAGFGKVVFVIRRDMEETFRDRVGRNIEGHAAAEYVFQELDDLPEGFVLPEGRTKPWGTGHAVLAARRQLTEPFAVINADDFYGASAFGALAGHLAGAHDTGGVGDYCLMGYVLWNTLSDHGHVARGVCSANAAGELAEINERTRIEKQVDETGRELARYTEDDGKSWVDVARDSLVSMNMWGFTPSYVRALEARFPRFLEERAADRTAEFFLPLVVDEMIRAETARVKVIPTDEKWYGVTYREDRATVKAAIAGFVAAGVYPDKLWA